MTMLVDSVEDIRAEAQAILRRLTDETAQLRDDQWKAISALVRDRRRVLCVQRTGWGKSAIYFVASALLRARGSGPTLIVSPLLALMRNQIEAAERAGISARTINSANPVDWHNIYDEIQDGIVDVLLVSPERLNNPDFRDFVLPDVAAATGLLVVDEAHCISDWGHDFRPDYRRIRTLLSGLRPRIPVLATTATANSRVVTDVAEQLGDTLIIRGPLDRSSLRLSVVSLPTAAHRLAWLSDHLNELQGSGIIYTLTVATAESVAAFLKMRGHNVVAYSAKTEDSERQAAEADLLSNDVKAVVATSALGMGFDKPDLGFVVHLGAPPSPISYYQQIGRAGRAIDTAHAILLPGSEDRLIWRYFAMLAFPPEEQVRVVLNLLAASDKPLSTQALQVHVDLGKTRLEHMLKVIDVDGAVRRVEGGWVATGQNWQHDAARYERITAARFAEQVAMEQYIQTDACRMHFLRRSLDDPDSRSCGRCDNCAGASLSVNVSDESLRAARSHFDRVGVDISPRTQWPSGLHSVGISLSGRIAATERAATGRSIARLSDAGWGDQLRPLLDDDATDREVSDGVLIAAMRVFDDWARNDAFRPGGVVWMGSRRRPLLVGSLAKQVSAKMNLPLVGMIPPVSASHVSGRANSARRVAALHSEIRIPAALASSVREIVGSVVLVDDVVDLGWTLTLAAQALRRAGATDVFPFALATTGRRE